MPSTGICRLIAEALLIRFLAISFVLWLSGTIRASIVVVDSRDNIYGAGLSSTPDILGDGMSPAVVNFAAAPNAGFDVSIRSRNGQLLRQYETQHRGTGRLRSQFSIRIFRANSPRRPSRSMAFMDCRDCETLIMCLFGGSLSN